MNYEINEEYLIQTRRYFHCYPELSLQEFETAKFIRRELKRFGIEYRTVGETGTLGAIHGRGEGKTVLLRADIDALPMQERTGLEYASKNDGVMHACGHDFHAAALLEAARVLRQQSSAFDGTVLLAFQPAEEFGHGSKFFVQEGLTKGYDRAFGIHVTTEFPVGTVALTKGPDASACAYFKITLSGTSAHISKPHQGADALAAAVETAARLSRLQSFFVDPLESVIVGVGHISAGSTWNIIARDAVIEGTVRTMSDGSMALLQNKVRKTATSTATLYDVRAETEFELFTPALINDGDAADEAKAVAQRLLGQENVFEESRPLMGFGGDDFAEFIRHEKGIYVHVGAANDDPASQVSLHSENLRLDEGALAVAARLHVGYALSILTGN